MKLGVFDSGLGGLVIANTIRKALPDHDMTYLGDTLRVPYGNRTPAEIMRFAAESVDHLMRQQNCALVIMACNTASALTLRGLQQIYLKQNFPDRRILGVVVPTLEAALENDHKKIGLLATQRTVESDVYRIELEKIDGDTRIFQQAAPRLVPAIEEGRQGLYRPLLQEYMAPLLTAGIDSLILGCTHYSFLKGMVQEIAGDGVHVMTQDELIPAKLVEYLERHPEIDNQISRQARTDMLVTKLTPAYANNAHLIFPERDIKEVKLDEIAETYDQPAGRPHLRLGRNAG